MSCTSASSRTVRKYFDGLPLNQEGLRRQCAPAFGEDAWHFPPSLLQTEPLERHIEALWQVVRPEIDYLKALKQRFKVDVFCGYRSNCDRASFEVSHTCLELFTALEVPFGVSVIVV